VGAKVCESRTDAAADSSACRAGSDHPQQQAASRLEVPPRAPCRGWRADGGSGSATMNGSRYSSRVSRPASATGRARMPHIELAAVQLLEHRRGLVLVQGSLQARPALADRGATRAAGTDRWSARAPPAASRRRIALAARQRDDLVARLEDAPARATISSPAAVRRRCWAPAR